MSKDLLAKIAKQNKTAQAMFEHFRSRERNPKDGIMDLKRTKLRLRDEGVDVIPDEFIANFKALEKAGVGKLVMEKGKPVSFRWTANMKEVASSIEEDQETPGLTQADGRGGRDNNVTEIAVVLGPDRDATISLPSDLTQKEAEFLYNTLMKRIKR